MSCSRSFPLMLLLNGLIAFAIFQPALAQELDETEKELIRKSSCIIGYNVAKNMISQDVEIDRVALLEGIQKAFEGVSLEMNDGEIEAVMTAFQTFTEKRQMEKMKRAADANKVEGEAFLAKNATRKEVQKLENGVQYEVLKTGSGDKPTVESTVSIHYHGTLPDGTVFDSSVQREQAAEFPVNRVVPGFSAALQAMKVGDKWRVVIPSHLAYGMQGPNPIGPNRTIIFEIELLQITK